MRRAVIFDLDGTLTVPMLDFDAIRVELGIEGGRPILEAMGTMDAAGRAWAEAVLEDHERRAAEGSRLRAGAIETVEALRGRGFAVGIVTRNARRWTEVVLVTHGLRVDGVRTREDGAIKPDPAGVRSLCEEFGARAGASWMVGDHLFDMEAGRGAGMATVLMVGDGEVPAFADRADGVIRSLGELLSMLPGSGWLSEVRKRRR